jgi:hypothetical protein
VYSISIAEPSPPSGAEVEERESGFFKVCYLTTVLLKMSRRIRWAGHVACLGERRGVYRGLVGKPEGKRPLGRPRRRWEDIIKIDLQEVGCRGMNWSELTQDRDRWRELVSEVMNIRVP